MNSNKFNSAKERLVIEASRKAAEYLLTKYGSAHLIDEPKVELTSTIDPNSSAIVFNGKITVYATDLLNPVVGVNMTVNSNDIEVESEESVQSKIENSLNAQTETSPVSASLGSFKLADRGDGYLLVSHSDLNDANLGIVSQNEYNASANKAELLKTVVKDSLTRVASENANISFVGEFKEPVIEKKSAEVIEAKNKGCKECGDTFVNENCHCGTCECGPHNKNKSAKKSWLNTADLNYTEAAPKVGDKRFCAMCDDYVPTYEDGGCQYCWNPTLSEEEKRQIESAKEVSISEDMPMARMSDHLAQSLQLEDQKVASAQEKVKTEAVNALVAMLHSMNYGTAKVAEVSMTDNKIDAMVTLDDAGTIKAVNIPVEVKESKVVLPKRSLVATLISKGLDINAKLSEEFSRQVLERIAAEEARVQFEQNEANQILAERPVVTKKASGYDNTQYLGDQDIMELQKHLIPNHEDLKKGDKISDGSSQWEIIDTEWQQNDKNKDSASIWKLRKCKAPESDKKEPETKIKI